MLATATVSTTNSTSDRRMLGILLIGALLLRALLPIVVLLLNGESQAFHAPDTSGYILLAKQLLSSGSFGGTSPELIRTPGYPLLMILGLSLGSLELVTIVLQILLSTATVALVYGVGRLIFVDRTSALLAAGLAAIEPLSILYTSMLLSEVLFTFLVTLSLYLMLRAMGDGER